MSSHRSTVAVAFAFAALAASADLRAQVGTGPEPASVRRPYRGLFGGPQDPGAPHSLVVSASAYGAYDDNVLEGLTNRRGPNSWLQRSGSYWGGHGGVNYTMSRSGERFSFGASSVAQLHYRQTTESYVTPYYNGELHVDARLTRSATVSVSQSVSYAPNYSASFVPVGGEDFAEEAVVPPDPDLELFPLQTLRTGSRLTLSQRFGRDTTLAGSYQFRTMDVDEADLVDLAEGESSRFRDYRSHAGSVRLNHSKPLTPHSALVLGYGVRVSDGRGNTAEPRVTHNVTAGIDYSRALSFSRRTSFSFGTGSAIVVSERLEVPDADSRTRFHLLGNANLVHEIGRTWTAQVAYARGLVSRDGFSELFSTDALTATIGGLVSRRLSMTGSAIWALSTLDRPGRNRHNGLSALARANYALTGYLAVYAQYLYYRYEYGDDIPLDPRLARGLERQGVRLGLTTSVPLIR